MSHPPAPTSSEPQGELVIRTIAMPADTNANGDIFGGWLLSQMDLGAAIYARNLSRSRVTTVAIDAMTFIAPVYVGDIVSCHATLLKVGRTSMRIAVEAWAQRTKGGELVRVTAGVFTYVAIDDAGRPQPVHRT
ncbi:acyl-CoA thioesterase [Opitutus sp. GAS368]|jgi:acyl-CoA thioesterase YciA|uniref:acyl-CoA thioesterase n=1 Tax=Opitutus sp. GAS368 TaxID=1882749 RepID=UPI000879B5C2|nr:acyl-CoA thioesterase [Opitutus sp. GAS368]SDR92552.1 acyl-CoA thioesterase YciA [Opitutus sp. GAS368]